MNMCPTEHTAQRTQQFSRAGSQRCGSSGRGPPRTMPTVHVQLESVSAALKAKIAALSGVAVVEKEGDLTLRQRGEQVQLLGPAGDPS